MPHEVTKPYTTLIVGYGVVGKNLFTELSELHPAVYDKYHNFSMGDYNNHKYDVAFICVDTPLVDNNCLDTTEVVNAINDNDAKIYVIKSTVPIGFTEQLTVKTGKRIVYSPEYYGATQHCNNVVFDFTILGGNRDSCHKVQQILQNCYDARHTFHFTDPRTAELSKLMENAWLATVVSFCTQMFEICQDYGLNYDELRELFILDPRVNPSHTFVYEDHPYWDSHCLNKDVRYIAYSQNAEFLQEVCKFNEHKKAT